MAAAGQAFENPVTGEKMVFGKTARDSNGMLLEIEFWIKPNSGRGLPAHFHPYFDERFEILGGSAHYIVGTVEHPANAGDLIVLPKGIPHVHPWNVGNDVLHVRKITQFDRPDKGLLLKSEEFFETLYALAQEGKTGTDGLPKNLLQKVVVGQALEPASYSATPPLWIQRPLFGLLAAIGRAFGYSGYYPAQYLLS
jgi:mannose-6-phosphate isomerase-like protein (cupin superfamily)